VRDIFALLNQLAAVPRYEPPKPRVHTMPDMIGMTGEITTSAELTRMVGK